MDFLEQLQIYVERVNNVLRRFIKLYSVQNTTLLQTIEYGALLGGKRLRPFLVYAIGNMFGIDNNILDVPAAAVECIHAYSLMHDDLPFMDNNNLRRGLPTCHMQFGEANTILAGNALHTLAFSILSDVPMIGVSNQDRLSMISKLAIASGISGICGGQILDIEIKKQKITIEELERIHHYKTGALIRAAVHLGALSAGDRSRNMMHILDRYATYIGLAFQVQDDILDIIGDTKILGKRKGADQKLKKITYPSLLGIKEARRKSQDLIDRALQSLEKLTTYSSLNVSMLEAVANYIIQRNK